MLEKCNECKKDFEVTSGLNEEYCNQCKIKLKGPDDYYLVVNEGWGRRTEY